MRARGTLALVASAAVFAGGCAAVLGFDETTLREDDGGAADARAGDGAGPEADASVSRLSVAPAQVVLRRGGIAEVKITRSGDLASPLTVRVEGAPAGVSAAPIAVAAGEATATLDLVAQKDAALGAAKARVVASAAGVAPADLDVTVADRAGALDVTFDGDGLATESKAGNGAVFHALAVQADGKILAGGSSNAGGGSWIIRRFSATGALDASFPVVADSLAQGTLQGLALTPSGRIVCVGTSTLGGGAAQLTVVRLQADGALDGTFAGGFVHLTIADAPLGSSGFAVAVQEDGAILAAGSRKEIGGESGVVFRWKKNGARDATFNGGKVAVVPKNRFVGVALREGGGFTLAGTDMATATPRYFLGARSGIGAVDPAFGTNGATTLGTGFRALAFTSLADGSLALAGDASNGVQYTAGMASAKGATAWVRGVAPGPGAGFYGLAAQADGRLVAAGHTTGPNPEARVTRLLPTGVVDASFGTGGTVSLDPAGANGFVVRLYAAAVQADGRILVAGQRTDEGAVVYRLWP